MFTKLLVASLSLLFVIPSVSADRRKYVWTYQFSTVAPDDAEFEFYQTTKVDDTDSWEYRMEIEHGLSPRGDLAIYQVFSQKENESLRWDAFQVRGRYKLAESGQYLLNPLLYVEYRRKIDLDKQNKAELKLILARDFDRVNLAINPVYEFFWAPGEPIHEIGLDVGLSYELSYKFAVGLESTSRVEYLKDAEDEKSSYFGPTLSFSTGDVFYTVGYATGLTDDSNNARVRFIMGIGL